MSKYFAFVDGQPYDFEFKKNGNWVNWRKFYLGEHFICFVIKDTYKAGWSVIVQGNIDFMETPTHVEGFVSRHSAIDYALKIHPKTRDHYNTSRRDTIAYKKWCAEEDKKGGQQ